MNQRRKGALSEPRKCLVVLMQHINFGRLEGVRICDAEPVFDPQPEIVREIKFGGDNGPRPELIAEDFVLKSEVVEMFDHLDQLRNGQIESLEIKHGLPFRMLIREPAA